MSSVSSFPKPANRNCHSIIRYIILSGMSVDFIMKLWTDTGEIQCNWFSYICMSCGHSLWWYFFSLVKCGPNLWLSKQTCVDEMEYMHSLLTPWVCSEEKDKSPLFWVGGLMLQTSSFFNMSWIIYFQTLTIVDIWPIMTLYKMHHFMIFK